MPFIRHISENRVLLTCLSSAFSMSHNQHSLEHLFHIIRRTTKRNRMFKRLQPFILFILAETDTLVIAEELERVENPNENSTEELGILVTEIGLSDR
jgi:hypothetical protein